MIMGSGLESTWSPATSQPPEKSYGPFQINLHSHPGVTESQAKDPIFAVRFMLPSYASAVAKVSDQLWQSDPKNAAALAAFYAERPAKMYAQSRVDNVWADMQANNYGTGQADSGSANPGTGTTGTGTAGGVQSIGIPGAGAIGDKVREVTLTAVFVLGGVAVVGLGLYRSVAPVVKRGT